MSVSGGITKAKWTTTSHPDEARSTAERSRISPQMISMPGRPEYFRARRRLRGLSMSRALTRCPWSTIASRVLCPTLPKAPVSRMFTFPVPLTPDGPLIASRSGPVAAWSVTPHGGCGYGNVGALPTIKPSVTEGESVCLLDAPSGGGGAPAS